MTSTTTMMFRCASRRARLFTDRLGNKSGSSLRSNDQLLSSGTKVFLSTRHSDDGTSAFQENQQLNLNPLPLPAVAYDFDEEDCQTDESSGDLMSKSPPRLENPLHSTAFNNGRHPRDVNRTDLRSSNVGPGGPGGPTSPHPYPVPSSVETGQSGPLRKMGGGGGGRHRCPKCGTTVTFRCDYEENTFYCASCSGWFAANPNLIVHESQNNGDGSTYEEFLAKKGSKKIDAPDVLMRHVSFFFLASVTFLIQALTYFSFFRFPMIQKSIRPELDNSPKAPK